jgi:hypothetical protein
MKEDTPASTPQKSSVREDRKTDRDNENSSVSGESDNKGKATLIYSLALLHLRMGLEAAMRLFLACS